LTGEHREYLLGEGGGEFGRITPIHPFTMNGSGWGSWQIALRYSYTDLNDQEIYGGKEDNYTVGINWYLNANLRWSINYIHVILKDRSQEVDGEEYWVDDGNMDIVMMRFQVDF
jgi:phosphate-selective porin OprO/OprP